MGRSSKSREKRKEERARRFGSFSELKAATEERAAAPAIATGTTTIEATRGDMVLSRRAARERWPINDAIRKSLVDQMVTVVETAEKERDRVGAAKVLLTADTINLRQEEFDHACEEAAKAKPVNGTTGPAVVVQVAGQQVAVGVDAARQLRQEMLNETKYLGYLRDGVNQGDGDSGVVCGGGVEGEVETSAASKADG